MLPELGEMLAKVFEAILDFIGERRYAARLIQCEVVTHEGYDVPREIFGTFFRDWYWMPIAPWTHIPSGNPPSVIAGGYCVIDASVLLVMRGVLGIRAQLQNIRPVPVGQET